MKVPSPVGEPSVKPCQGHGRLAPSLRVSRHRTLVPMPCRAPAARPGPERGPSRDHVLHKVVLRLAGVHHDKATALCGQGRLDVLGPTGMRRSRCVAATIPTDGSDNNVMRLGRWPFRPEPTSVPMRTTGHPLDVAHSTTGATCPSRSERRSDDETRTYTATSMAVPSVAPGSWCLWVTSSLEREACRHGTCADPLGR